MTARVLGLAQAEHPADAPQPADRRLRGRRTRSCRSACWRPLPRGPATAGAVPLSLVLLMALLFPVYYNLLSMFVTRRDELVLKRLRSGEATDAEIIASMALPGVALVFVVAGIAAVVAGALGYGLPTNPILLVARAAADLRHVRRPGPLDGGVDEERRGRSADQRFPVLMLATIGSTRAVFPPEAQRWLDLLPGAALEDLVRVAWFGLEPGALGTDTVTWWATWVEAAARAWLPARLDGHRRARRAPGDDLGAAWLTG